jgi:RNA polymerase sigma factor (sigma-70 family)
VLHAGLSLLRRPSPSRTLALSIARDGAVSDTAGPDEATLDALMARLARGERAAFEPLFRALAPRASRVAHARLDAAAADDVAQSALLKVFARAHEFTPGRSALAWFYAIVANEVRAARRTQRVHDTLSGEERASDAPDGEALALARELSRALEAALAELDPAASEAIHALLGRGPAPVLESATLRKRVSRAYARLRILLGDLR